MIKEKQMQNCSWKSIVKTDILNKILQPKTLASMEENLIFSDIIMWNLLNKVKNKFQNEIKFAKLYVDDMFLVIPNNLSETLLRTLIPIIN